MRDASAAAPSPSATSSRRRSLLNRSIRLLLGLACLYQTAFTLVVGIDGGIPAIPQALLAASLLSGWGASLALWVIATLVCLANLAPFFDVPLYPWFTLSHPLMNAVIFALCGIAWLARPVRERQGPQAIAQPQQ